MRLCIFFGLCAAKRFTYSARTTGGGVALFPPWIVVTGALRRARATAKIEMCDIVRRLYSASMGHVRPALAIASLIAACVACARSDGNARHHRERVIAASHGPAPAADFLVSAGDSTFWVTSGANGIRARGEA